MSFITGVAGGAVAGTVMGPGSSTDNAAVRWDGITGTLTQNSLVIISDLGAITGAKSLNLSDLTTSTALVADGSKNITSSAVTATELGYVSGVTSAIQTQFSSKVTGPASATDNGIVRYDGTTGKLVQDSLVTIADTTGAVSINTATGARFQAGTTSLNDWFSASSVYAVSSTQQAFLAVRTALDAIIGVSNSQGLTGGFGMVQFLVMPEAERNIYLQYYNADTAVGGYTFRGDNAGNFQLYGNLTFATDNTKDIGASVANRPANIHVATQVLSGSNNAAVPGLSFDADPDTGITSDNANKLIFSTGGSQRATLDSTGLLLNNISASRAVINNASGILEESVTTSAELAFVNGVTSAIQTQLDAKVATSGRLKLSRVAVADADYTVLTSDYYVGLTSVTVSRTFTLPAAATAGTGSLIVIKDESGSVSPTIKLIVDGNASETIDGATTFEMTSAYESLSLMCNGSNWFII